MAFAGRLYCFAFSLRSSTKEGKTSSNFFFASWDDMMVEQGSQVPIRVVGERGWSARYAGASMGGSGRDIPANGTKIEALKVRAPYNFGACPIGTAMRNCSEFSTAALGIESLLKVPYCSVARKDCVKYSMSKEKSCTRLLTDD